MRMEAVAAALLVALACWLALPLNGLIRLDGSGDRHTAMPNWVVGRPDAVALRLRIGIGMSAAGLAGLALGLPLLVLAVVAVGAGVPGAVVLGHIEPVASRRRSARMAADLPQACGLLAACLDSGLPLREAARIVGGAVGGPIGEGFDRVTTQVSLGISEAEAWRSLDHPALARLGKDLARAAASGSVTGAVLRAHGQDAALKARSSRQEAARRVGVHSVLPLMACFLPAFMLVGVVPIVGGYVLHWFG